MNPLLRLAPWLLVLSMTACSIADRRAGLENRWRSGNQNAFRNGVTKEAEVLQKLGPPSQIIPLKDRTVFYYLLEDAHTEGLNLIIYAQSDTLVRYDRAIFFFDAQGVLEKSALSAEAFKPE